MDFIAEAEARGQNWCAHLSYIKPHWPYIVPAPYHAMYGPQDVPPAMCVSACNFDPVGGVIGIQN